jgi:hypothetical protein
VKSKKKKKKKKIIVFKLEGVAMTQENNVVLVQYMNALLIRI